jgi:hypothetical protein
MSFKIFDISLLHGTFCQLQLPILIIGQKNSGKYEICNKIIDINKDIPEKIVVLENNKNIDIIKQKYNCPMDFLLNDHTVHDKIISSQMNKCINHINDPRLLLIIDCDLSTIKDITMLLCNARSYYMTIIVILNCTNIILPIQRNSFGYIFICNVDNYKYRKQVFDNYDMSFKTFEEFTQLFDKIPQNFNAFVFRQHRCVDLIAEQNNQDVFVV